MPLSSQPSSRSHLTLALLSRNLWTLTDNICSFRGISLQRSSHCTPCPSSSLEWERSCQSNETGWMNGGPLATWPPLVHSILTASIQGQQGPSSHAGTEEGWESDTPGLQPTSVAEVCSARSQNSPCCIGHWRSKGEDRVPSGNSVREPRLSTKQTQGLNFSTINMFWAPAASHHLGVYQKCRISAPAPNLMSQNLYW